MKQGYSPLVVGIVIGAIGTYMYIDYQAKRLPQLLMGMSKERQRQWREQNPFPNFNTI